MDRWASKVAVVTGASAGIGLAISAALVREGMIVVGLARRKSKMEEAMKQVTSETTGVFHARQCDVSDERSVAEAFRWIGENLGPVQILVNNAGIAVHGSFMETTSEHWQRVMNVNVMAVFHCTHQAVRTMKEADVEGHIVNINSIQGHGVHLFPNQAFNVYPSSKHAVTGFAELLRKEMTGDKIRVTNISPGIVRTEILKANDFPTDYTDLPALEPEDIAEAVVYVVGTPQRVQVTELMIRPVEERN